MIVTRLWLFALIPCGWLLFAAAAPDRSTPRPPREAAVDYNRDILPILSHACFNCHGPAENKAGVRLDLRVRATQRARSGLVPIQPGQSGASEVMRRIYSEQADERMPPPQSKTTLTAAQKELLKRWIDQGAEYKEHWAFIKAIRPALPIVRDQAWPSNAVDAFILERLEKAGLNPSPRADKATLIRRLSLDLRGLPPSLEEVDAFVADQRPDAYARLVDRMLASPHYGEKMAELWLDLARFGDTSGFHFDSTRQMWLWRDWVINAFNSNMPFDRFTIEQVAGDLLPHPTMEQKIATGFHRNTRFNEEGGVDPEEFVIRYNVDRTNTLGQVWLGLTLGCAECHSHKYDPISQKEYYQLFAYFTGIKEPMVSDNHNQPLPPLLMVPTAEQTKTLASLRQELADLQSEVAREAAKIDYHDPLENNPDAGKLPAEAEDVIWLDDAAPPGARLLGEGSEPWKWVSLPAYPVYSGRRSMVRAGPGLHQHYFTGARNPIRIYPGDKLFVYIWLDPSAAPRSIQLQYNDGSWDHRAYWGEDLCYGAGQADGPSHLFAGRLPKLGQWARLEIDTGKIGLSPGALVDGMAFTQFGGTVYYDKVGVSTVFPPDDRILTSQIAWEPRGLVDPRVPSEVQAALKVGTAERSVGEKSLVRDYYLVTVYGGARDTFEPLATELERIRKQIKETEDAVPHTLVTEEMAEPRAAHVLLRGDFLQKGEHVHRAVPAFLPPLPAGAPNDRLGLAQWLVHPDHPLTARVAVNRIWAQMFGAGVVPTLGDFGNQGEFPSHPELLDWLAVEFMQSGWDVKAILKKMAMSSAYQQSSVVTGGLAEKVDPHNRLLSRALRFRLSAEEIRDSALAISGLLSAKIGGPSVMPYQPPDFYKGKHEDWIWNASTGEDQYRRGIYTFWRRTNLHPMFAVFDAPARAECTVSRPRTNTPSQALVTLNDPSFVEAARVFAQNILASGLTTVEGRLTFGFRAAVARTPTSAELGVLKAHYQTILDRYRSDLDAASKLVHVGAAPRLANLDIIEHAAWTGIAQILLNLDETITRE
jgi:hypothetical protein